MAKADKYALLGDVPVRESRLSSPYRHSVRFNVRAVRPRSADSRSPWVTNSPHPDMLTDPIGLIRRIPL
jgi:hypothetical protein